MTTSSSRNDVYNAVQMLTSGDMGAVPDPADCYKTTLNVMVELPGNEGPVPVRRIEVKPFIFTHASAEPWTKFDESATLTLRDTIEKFLDDPENGVTDWSNYELDWVQGRFDVGREQRINKLRRTENARNQKLQLETRVLDTEKRAEDAGRLITNVYLLLQRGQCNNKPHAAIMEACTLIDAYWLLQ